MLYLMIINRSHEVIKIMGHDVKQFKSLEGFLESGPQFILQSYILLRGEKHCFEVHKVFCAFSELEKADLRISTTPRARSIFNFELYNEKSI